MRARFFSASFVHRKSRSDAEPGCARRALRL